MPEHLKAIIDFDGTLTAKEQQVTVLQIVPTFLKELLDEPELGTCRSLRHVLSVGELLPAALRDRFFERMDAVLHNCYGPTETCIHATSWNCERGSRRRSVPIGRPIANAQVYVLDSHLNPVPIGVPGELHIGGDGLARAA